MLMFAKNPKFAIKSERSQSELKHNLFNTSKTKLSELYYPQHIHSTTLTTDILYLICLYFYFSQRILEENKKGQS